MKNRKQPLNIEIISVKDGFAYDVTVNDENATIGDYINMLDVFLEEKVAPCIGCDLCCKQRIPLTLPDLYTYAGKKKEDIEAFLKEKAVIKKSGSVYDVQLAQRNDGSCIYLDQKNQRCLDHSQRSLVCHTYICLPQTERARNLREELINNGEDALFGALFDLGILEEAKGKENYPRNPLWQGKSFDEIKLKEVLSPSVYKALL
jgi:Fe-S-cluster containining protein